MPREYDGKVARASDSTQWRGEPLPSGRHRLTPEQVKASQRSRLLRAMLESVAEQGYAGTTVPEVVARARVSRNAFYEFFADKEACFVAACDEVAVEILAALAPFDAEPEWTSALLKGVHAYLAWWQERPRFARAHYVELPQAGADAVAQRDRANRQFGELLRRLGLRARREQPELGPLPDLVPRVLVYAFAELVAEEIRAGRLDTLTGLAPELGWLALRLLADDATAERIMGGEPPALRAVS